MNYHKHRWRIAIISCLMNLCLGVNYAWSVFAQPLADRLNDIHSLSGAAVFDSGSLAIIFSLTNAILPIPMILGGAINDRYGPKALVFAGGLSFGAGIFLTGLVPSKGLMIITYSLMAGIGNSLVYACTINNTVKFFPDKKGLIGGLTTASYGIGSIIYAPIARIMISGLGISRTMQIFGIIVTIVICIGAFFLVKPASQTINTKTSPLMASLKWHEMIRKPIFYCILLMLAVGSLSGMLIISQASSVAQEMANATLGTATMIVSLIAVFNTAGRLICGYISDKIGRINVITGALIISFIGMIMAFFSASGSPTLLAIGACMAGLCFGCFMGVYPGLTADHFGLKYNTLNYGIIFIGNSIGAMAGPSLITSIHTSTGSYQSAFLVAAGLAVFGIILTIVYRFMAKSSAKEAGSIN